MDVEVVQTTEGDISGEDDLRTVFLGEIQSHVISGLMWAVLIHFSVSHTYNSKVQTEV